MFGKNEEYLNNFLAEQKKINRNKKLKLIFMIGIPVVFATIIIIIIVASSSSSSSSLSSTHDSNIYAVFNQSTFFFFDPVSEIPCNESNYWTPFDRSTTCFRFISITSQDSNKSSTIKLMLDHNLALSNFTNLEKILKNKTSNWSRYKGSLDIIDESTIMNLMRYKRMPNITHPVVSTSVKAYPFFSNSFYINKGMYTNQRGYWTKTAYDHNQSFCIDRTGHNRIRSMTWRLGVRPIINIEKSLLTISRGIIDITDILENSTKIFFKYDNTKYNGLKYNSLQSMTFTKDKLLYMCANNGNKSQSVMNAYELKNLSKAWKRDYSSTGHGSGMTYNSKINKVLVVGPSQHSKIYEYNADTLIREKVYSKENGTCPGSSAIGYHYDLDLYFGRSEMRLFLMDTVKMKKIYGWDGFTFENGQDFEYYNGYLFDCQSDFGGSIYSFYRYYQYIYVYDFKVDKDKKPTKNFGRLKAKFGFKGKLGELESVSFRDGYMYLAILAKPLKFYKIKYKEFIEKTKTNLM